MWEYACYILPQLSIVDPGFLVTPVGRGISNMGKRDSWVLWVGQGPPLWMYISQLCLNVSVSVTWIFFTGSRISYNSSAASRDLILSYHQWYHLFFPVNSPIQCPIGRLWLVLRGDDNKLPFKPLVNLWLNCTASPSCQWTYCLFLLKRLVWPRGLSLIRYNFPLHSQPANYILEADPSECWADVGA